MRYKATYLKSKRCVGSADDWPLALPNLMLVTPSILRSGRTKLPPTFLKLCRKIVTVWIINNVAAHWPIVLKYDALAHRNCKNSLTSDQIQDGGQFFSKGDLVRCAQGLRTDKDGSGYDSFCLFCFNYSGGIHSLTGEFI